MDRVTQLTQRLSQIAHQLETSPDGLGLLGLGSVGIETGRLDQWSDLDFFVIVKKGYKAAWINDTQWLESVYPLAWIFRNTVDGFKILFKDGIFAEMAIFEPDELGSIPYSPGRWIWRHDSLDAGLAISRNPAGVYGKLMSVDFILGEWLSCLYVGLCRYRRGEKLSAWRFIQGYCLDRFLEIIDRTQTAKSDDDDPYNRERRFESRYPDAARELDGFLPGYARTTEAAQTMLDWVSSRYPVNPELAAEIKALIAG